VTDGVTLQFGDAGVVYAADVKVGDVVSEEAPPPFVCPVVGLRLLGVMEVVQATASSDAVASTIITTAVAMVGRAVVYDVAAEFLFARSVIYIPSQKKYQALTFSPGS
jgi:hypothetical protein